METCPVCQSARALAGACQGCGRDTPPDGHAGAPATVVSRPAAAAPRLVVLRGESPGIVFPLLPGRNTLGRCGERPVDIELSGQEHAERTWTSRQHACVRVEAGDLTVEDLMSLNGTFLNGSRVHPGQPRPAQAGDILQLGTIQMRVEMG